MTRVREQPERGTSAVIVAIVMLVLIGFAGLGVDVTSAYAKSQEIQNAADAAALATAQHCAKQDSGCTDGSQAGPATSLAQENVLIQVETVHAWDTYPAGNRVTIEVTAEHQNVFAGALGFNSFTVVREATAQWDSPKNGVVTLPLTISACTFFEQAVKDEHGQPVLDSLMEIWQPQGGSNNGKCSWHKDYPPGGFGWLGDGKSCEVPIDINDPWVIGDSGINVLQCVKDDIFSKISLGKPVTVLLPVFDGIKKVKGDDFYHIMRFAVLEVEGMQYQTGNPSSHPADFKCVNKPSPTNSYSKTCIKGTFAGWVEVDGEYLGGDDSEMSIRLVDPDYENHN